MLNLRNFMALGLIFAVAACASLPPPKYPGPRPGGPGGGQPSPIARDTFTIPTP